MTATVDNLQLGGAGNLTRETHTPRAHDAAIGKQRDVIADVIFIRLVQLLIDHAGLGPTAILEGVVLQIAFAGLIASWAIKRMVEEQILKRASLSGFHFG